MKIRFFFCWVLASLLLAAPACAGQGASRADDAVYQVSTINSLLEGVYDGVVRCGDLPRHGDTGIGTFDRLDGEMIVLDGVVYQARSDGRVVRVKPSVTSPFAMVTRFSSDDSWMTTSVQSLDGLQNSIRSRLENPNVFYAVRVDGEFDFVKVRSVPAQSKPYPRLSEAAKEQKVFEFHNVTGTLVGYWSPCWVGTMGVPGFHLHFLSADRSGGGHLLEVRVKKARVRVDETPYLDLVLPETAAFAKADLCGENRNELKAIEGDTKSAPTPAAKASVPK